MAFHPPAHGRPLVIQGNFQGRMPAFAAQAKPGFTQAAGRQRTPHVQAALQRHAPPGHTAQRHVGTPPQAAQPSRMGNAFRVPPTVNLSNPGQERPLPEAVRQQMESFFKTDFSDVRVHVGAQAKSIGAVAFTLGSQIHFAPGQYNPNTSHGQQLLGHELTHVMQQRAGRVRNPFGGGVAVVQDPGLEAEADRMGIQASAHRVPVQATMAAQQQPAPGGRPQAPHVQAAVGQAKTAQPHAQVRLLTTGGKPEVIQGKFPGGFAQIVRFHQQAGTIQPKTTGSAIQLAPSQARFWPGDRGRPLPVLVQRKMERLFGTTFDAVRIHEGPEAQQLGAQAFTRGSDIYFAPGQYNPRSPQGQRLLGHELAHVVQQRTGRVRNPFGGGVAVVQEPGMEAEADRMGKQASAHRVPVQAKLSGGAGSERVIQCWDFGLGPILVEEPGWGVQGQDIARTRGLLEGLTPQRKKTFIEAMATVRAWVGKAVEFTEHARQTVEAGGSDNVTGTVMRALKWFFKFDDLNMSEPDLTRLTILTLTTILSALRKVAEGLAGPQVIIDLNTERLRGSDEAARARGENPSPGVTLGYVAVYSSGRKSGKCRNTHEDSRGNIHLRFALLDGHVDAAADTIIHEATHRYVGTTDVAYVNDSGAWDRMTREEALNNADSYAKYVGLLNGKDPGLLTSGTAALVHSITMAEA